MIARVARQTGQSIPDVLALDGPMFAAALDEADEESPLLEVLRVQCDLLHSLIRVVVRAVGGDVEEWHYPRPGEEPPEPMRLSPLALAQQLQRRG